jgi:hypothetical protein
LRRRLRAEKAGAALSRPSLRKNRANTNFRATFAGSLKPFPRACRSFHDPGNVPDRLLRLRRNSVPHPRSCLADGRVSASRASSRRPTAHLGLGRHLLHASTLTCSCRSSNAQIWSNHFGKSWIALGCARSPSTKGKIAFTENAAAVGRRGRSFICPSEP